MTDIAPRTDLSMIYGDDEYITGTVFNANGTRKDLTAMGINLVCTLKTGVQGGTLLTKSIGSGIVVDAGGNYAVKISHADKASISPVLLDALAVVHALRLTDTTGTKTTQLRGTLTFYGTTNG